jgi:outer membrane protein assembly factor BamB
MGDRMGRRHALRRAAATAVALSALVVGLSGCWRQPGYGPLRQGWNPVEQGLTTANVATLAPAWTARVETGAVRSDPVLSGAGLVHVSDDRAAYGIDPASGRRRWRTEVVPATLPPESGARAGALTSDETTVYVPWGGVPDSGALVRLDAASGAQVGSEGGIGLTGPIRSGDWWVSSFSGFAEQTLGAAGVTVRGPQGTRGSVLTGYEINTAVPAPTPPAVTRDRFYVGLETYWDGRDLLAAWPLAGPPAGSPCGDSPIPGCAPAVRTQLDGIPTTPVVSSDESTVYVATNAGTVYAVDTATGAVRWTAAVGAPVAQRPALTQDALYVVTGARTLVAFDPGGCGGGRGAPSACRPSWTTGLAGTPVAAPAVAGGVVYVASAGGSVEAFPAAGRPGSDPLWSASVGSEITGGPTVANGRLLVGTGDGRVVAFAPQTD